MVRLFWGTLVVGFMVNCAPEAEETSSSLTVNPNRGVAIPEGVTVHDADLNSDGTINMDDLVIVGKFFGQDVPQDLSSSSDLSAADTSEYIYATLTTKKYYASVAEGLPFKDEYEALPKEVTFAFKFLTKKIDDIYHVVEVTVKPVDENPILSETITQSLTTRIKPADSIDNYPEMTIDGGGRFGKVHVTVSTWHYAIHQQLREGPIQIGEKNGHNNIDFINIVALRTNTRDICTDDKSVAINWGSEHIATLPTGYEFFNDDGYPDMNTGEKIYCQEAYLSPVAIKYFGYFGGSFGENTNSEEVRSQYFPNDP